MVLIEENKITDTAKCADLFIRKIQEMMAEHLQGKCEHISVELFSEDFVSAHIRKALKDLPVHLMDVVSRETKLLTQVYPAARQMWTLQINAINEVMRAAHIRPRKFKNGKEMAINVMVIMTFFMADGMNPERSTLCAKMEIALIEYVDDISVGDRIPLSQIRVSFEENRLPPQLDTASVPAADVVR
jgi:hypothetical protein